MISNALNKYHQAALRTTELTALAVLTGEATRAMESGLANAVAFESIKENVRGLLDATVGDPSFVEVYDYVVSNGAGEIVRQRFD